jgi:peroxiredoxin
MLLLIASFLLLVPLFAVTVPRPAPDYAVKTPAGRMLPLSSYRGQVVALMFVFTDCPHCQLTCRFMNSLQKQYGSRGFQTLAVAFNQDAAAYVKLFTEATGAQFPIGVDKRETVLSFLQLPVKFRMFVPTLVFIDRKGMIRGQYIGGDRFFDKQDENIRAVIETLLGEPVPATSVGKRSTKTR